jgi:hypothetical protein
MPRTFSALDPSTKSMFLVYSSCALILPTGTFFRSGKSLWRTCMVVRRLERVVWGQRGRHTHVDVVLRSKGAGGG